MFLILKGEMMKQNENSITIETLIDYDVEIKMLTRIIGKLVSSDKHDLLYFVGDEDHKKCIDILIDARQSQIDDFNDALRDMAKQG